jgi:hypothetical protein
MAGIANLLFPLLGSPDPSRQIAAILSGQQPPPGAPPQGPAPPPPPGGAAAAGPGDGSAPAAQPATPGAPPPPGSPPQAQALQSTPDMAQSYAQLANPPNLMNLYIQAQQRDQAMQGFNSGLALIAANHSPPSMRNAIMQSANAGAGDASGMVGNLMSLYQTQNQMAAQQQMLAHADEYDAKLNLPSGTSRTMILAGRGDELVKASEPTTEAKNYQWAHDTYAKNHPGASPEEIEEGAQGLLMGMGGMGGGDAATRSWRAAKIQWDQNPATKGTPYPWGAGADDTPTSFAAWQGAQKAAESKQADDQQDASRLGPQYRANLQGARDRVAGILGIQADGSIDPAREAQLKTLLGTDMAQKYVSSDPTKETWGQDLATWWGGLKPEDQTLLTQIRDATDEKILIGGLKNRAPRRGTADASDIGVGLSGMRNVTQGYDDWITGAKNTLKAIDSATVNSFGAQGTPEQAEDYARKHNMPVDEALQLMDDNYVSGGSMYPKGKFTGTMPQPQLAAATAAIKAAADPEAERQKQIKLALVRNFDPKPLKDLRL